MLFFIGKTFYHRFLNSPLSFILSEKFIPGNDVFDNKGKRYTFSRDAAQKKHIQTAEIRIQREC